MKVKVRFFASLRDITKLDHIDLNVESNSIESLLQTLCGKYPELNNYTNSIRIAVNSAYSEKNQNLNENDVVALIPPTSGG